MEQNERNDDFYEKNGDLINNQEKKEDLFLANKDNSDLSEGNVFNQEQENELQSDNHECSFSPFAYGVEQPDDEIPEVQFSESSDQEPVEPIYYPNTQPPVPPKKSKKGLIVFGIVIACIVAIIISVSAGYYLALKSTGKSDSNKKKDDSSSLIDGKKDGEGEKSSFDIDMDDSEGATLSISNVIKSVKDSIVSITIYNSDGSGGRASGIIMSKDGYILTNDHIYASVANPKFLITLNNGTELKAEYVSGDARSDIAILKITSDFSDLKAATFGKSDKLQEGESVLAIGQSAGLSSTVTNGIVSALNRRISSGNNSYTEKYIQTTAAINPGNSGGALVNMRGQVVGVTSSKYVNEDVEGICFAIPVDKALNVVKELQENGKVVSRAKLGITYTAVDTITAELNDVPTGLYIQSISEDSGLYGKGFVKGDIITEIDGKVIKNYEQVLDIIEEASVGQSIDLSIYQSATQKTSNISVTLVQAESSSSYTTQSQSKPSQNSSNPDDFLPFNGDGGKSGQ